MEKEKKAGFSGVGTKKYDYDRQYHKDHYKRVHLVVKPELLDRINQAAKDAGQSKNGWIVDAILDKLKTEQLKLFLFSCRCWNCNIYEDFTSPTIP